MGRRGPHPGAKAAAARASAAAAPPAQGTATKRTPTGAFDPAAGKDTYEPASQARIPTVVVSAEVTGLHRRGVSVQSENPLDTEGLKGTSG